MEALLPRRIPNLIAQHMILKPALLRKERGADGRFLVCLELVRNLGRKSEH